MADTKKTRRRGRSGSGNGTGRPIRSRTGEASAPAETARMTPGGYLAALEGRTFIQLSRDRARLRADFGRLAEARKTDPDATIGRGWTMTDLAQMVDLIGAEQSAKEADFLEVLFSDLAEPDDGMAPPPPGAEEFIYIEPEGGIHPHMLEADGATTIGGRHSHAFLWAGEVLFTEFDGVHRHDADPDNADMTAAEEEHEHVAFLPDGQRVVFRQGAAHTHEKLTSSTTMDGLHQHEAEVEGEGEQVQVRTLSPSEFRELFVPTMESRAAEAVAGMVSAMPHIRILEAQGAGQWAVTIIEAGLSINGNFWPADVLAERGAAVFENAPLEVLEFSPTHFSHAPYDPHRDLPAGVVANTAGLLTGVTFESTGGSAPSPEKAEAIGKLMGWTIEQVMEKSTGRLVALAKLDGSQPALDMQAKLSFAAEEGLLADYLGLSIDVGEAEPRLVNVRNGDGTIDTMAVRTDISADAGVLVDFVSRPSAGGSIDAEVAA